MKGKRNIIVKLKNGDVVKAYGVSLGEEIKFRSNLEEDARFVQVGKTLVMISQIISVRIEPSMEVE